MLRIRTVDQQERPVLDFWRCAMLPLRDPEGRTGRQGDFASIPVGAEHSYAMEANFTRFVSMYGPAGLERLHEVAGQAAEQRIFPEQGEPVDRDRLVAAAAELDIAFVGE